MQPEVARKQQALLRRQQEREVKALEESLKTAITRYTGGRASYPEVLNA